MEKKAYSYQEFVDWFDGLMQAGKPVYVESDRVITQGENGVADTC